MNIYLSIIVRCLTVSVCITIFIAPVFAQSNVDLVADSAQHLCTSGRYSLAISYLEKSIQDRPDSIRFHRLLGFAYLQIHEDEKALKEYLRASDIGHCDSCHSDLDTAAAIAIRNKDYDAATKYAEKAVERKSRWAPVVLSAVHISKGDDELAQNKYDDALDEYRKALEIAEDTLPYQRILGCYSDIGNDTDLLRLSAKLVNKYPSFYAPRGYLCDGFFITGVSLFAVGDLTTALGLFRQASEYDPSQAGEIDNEIGVCYLALKDTSEALIYFGNALFDPLSSPEASVQIAEIYQSRNQIGPAILTLQNALNQFPVAISDWSKLSELYLLLGKRSESIECEKISAKLGNVSARERLKNNFINFGDIDLKLLPWLTNDPFDYRWYDSALFSGRPVDAEQVEKQPMPVKTVQPDYPEQARRSGIEGVVWIKLLIGKNGTIRRESLLKCDDQIFAGPALIAAQHWKFTPATINGKPVSVWAVIPFRFKINH